MSSIVFVSPTGGWLPRENDSYGSGRYGASRKRIRNGRVVRQTHPGLDLYVVPGRQVVSPVVGQVFRHIQCYSDGPGADHFTGISIDASWCRIELLYVGFDKDVVPVGHVLDAGDPVGTAQDLRTRYPAGPGGRQAITPHIHIEFVRIDPAAVWAATGIIKKAGILAEALRDI